jgi:C1A family cysteine protease
MADTAKGAAQMPGKHSYGWMPDLPDHRDFLFAGPLEVMTALPAKVDLSPGCPKEIYDQGQLGSCTANAIAGALEFDQIKEGAKQWTPSRLFIYYNERVLEHTVNSDSGARIRDGIKTVGSIGAPPETVWPYDIAVFETKPSKPAFAEAPLGKALTYQRVPQILNQMKACLAAGYPVVFGFTVYESFESQQVAQTGVVPMPNSQEKVLGGHAVLAVGYDDATQCFLVRNSWGQQWGQQGYFTIPYAYLTDNNLSDDFWTIRLVAKTAAQIAADKAAAAADAAAAGH